MIVLKLWPGYVAWDSRGGSFSGHDVWYCRYCTHQAARPQGPPTLSPHLVVVPALAHIPTCPPPRTVSFGPPAAPHPRPPSPAQPAGPPGGPALYPRASTPGMALFLKAAAPARLPPQTPNPPFPPRPLPRFPNPLPQGLHPRHAAVCHSAGGHPQPRPLPAVVQVRGLCGRPARGAHPVPLQVRSHGACALTACRS